MNSRAVKDALTAALAALQEVEYERTIDELDVCPWCGVEVLRTRTKHGLYYFTPHLPDCSKKLAVGMIVEVLDEL